MDNVVIMDQAADQMEQIEVQMPMGREYGPDKKATVLRIPSRAATNVFTFQFFKK